MSFIVESEASNAGGQLFCLEDSVSGGASVAAYSSPLPIATFLPPSSEWSLQAPMVCNGDDNLFAASWTKDANSIMGFSSGSSPLATSQSDLSFYQRVLMSSSSSSITSEGTTYPVPIKEEPIESKVDPFSLVAHESLDDLVKQEPFPVLKSEPESFVHTRQEARIAHISDAGSDSESYEDTTADESSVAHSTPSHTSSQPGSRKDFRDNVARFLYEELQDGELSYDELIEKYRQMHPQYASKFTKNFLTKLRTGRVCNAVTGLSKRRVKSGDIKMKRVKKISSARVWGKMTDELYERILAYESLQGTTLKREEIENRFNVNRTTFYRWRKQNYGK